MENTPLKFRQPVFINGKFNRWHYWGFISDKDEFAGITAPFHVAKKSQQFIGRTNRQGIEIYVGDILKDDVGDILEVKFGELPFDKSGDCVCSYKAFYCKNYGQSGHALPYSCQDFGDWMEVIGNTTENPELLRSD